MSSGCGDVLSLADLQTAKKHQIFEAEVITGKSGGVAGGADIDYATNQVTGQTQKTLPAVLRDAGFSPVSWDFSTGGTLTVNDRGKVVYDPVSKTWYSYAGTLPVTAPAGFNPAGNADWKPQTDPNLREELASSAPGKGVDLVAGAAKGSDLISLSNRVSGIEGGEITDIESYSNLTDGDDWTAAIQAALDTGLNVTSSVPGKVYKVSSKLKSKGQKLLGAWSIDATHTTDAIKNLGPVKIDESLYEQSDAIRIVYTTMTWDLCELLYMRRLGFTMLHSYGNFAGDSYGSGGSVSVLLDNSLSAGLKVQLGTEDSISASNLNMTVEDFIDEFDSHPAVWGYSVYDEPGTRRIPVSTQDSKISTMRQHTNKTLTMVDLIVGSNSPFYDYWSKNYDVVFVDSYAQHYTTGTITEKKLWDQEKNRIDIGGIKAMTRCRKIVPVTGLFVSSEGQYSRDKDQLIANTLFFGRQGGGEYGCFVWDMPWETVGDKDIRSSVDFLSTCKSLSNQSVTFSLPRTDYYIFGTAPGYADWGIGDVMRVLPVRDSNLSDASGWLGAFPVRRTIGSNTYSGIGFNKTFSSLPTTIECRKVVSYFLDAFNTAGMVGGTTLRINSSLGSGQTSPIAPDYNVSTNPTFHGSSVFGPEGYSKTLTIQMLNSNDYANYELFLRGLIVTTDW